MLNKKVMLLFILIGICMISSACAADLNASEIQGTCDGEVISESIVIEDDLKSSDEIEVLSAEYEVDEKTFAAIQNKVTLASAGDTIILKGEYEGNGNPITVDKKLTFQGHDNAILNAKGLSAIILSSTDGVVFKDITFVNANGESEGGAIYKAEAINCTFNDCKAKYGGAMYLGTAINSTFFNCRATMGGALYDCQAYNSTFESCEASEGGAMYQGYAEKCTFTWCNMMGKTLGSSVTQKNCIFDEYIDDDDYEDEYVSAILGDDKTVYYNSGSYFKVIAAIGPSDFYEYTPYVFKIKGKKVASGKTNINGVAKFKITQKPGKYKVEVKFTKLSLKSYFYITVKHVVKLKTVEVKKSAKKLVLKATLKNNKKVLKNKKVTFKFDGKIIKTAKTNKKGVAKVTVPKSILKKVKVGKKVTYKATYLKDTVKKTVEVVK